MKFGRKMHLKHVLTRCIIIRDADNVFEMYIDTILEMIDTADMIK